MRFLLDENVRSEVEEALRKAGHNTHRPVSGVSDLEVAALARRERRILITHDKGFANILAYPPKDYPGIIVLRVRPPKPRQIVRALKNLFRAPSEQGLAGTLVILETDRFRVKR